MSCSRTRFLHASSSLSRLIPIDLTTWSSSRMMRPALTRRRTASKRSLGELITISTWLSCCQISVHRNVLCLPMSLDISVSYVSLQYSVTAEICPLIQIAHPHLCYTFPWPFVQWFVTCVQPFHMPGNPLTNLFASDCLVIGT